ncbi:uncharacterized protein LOC125671385 isoform X2 [Ostrea edulis]|nr:uncharacterized protein LOC125671385 isoform X2 [Ostrea edulis]XP_055995937.1 uncharacterized protein LOC125671385 isoform X2 [Ostrea edulis]
MLKEVLSKLPETNSSKQTSEKSYGPGRSLIFASKTTSGNDVGIQLELFVTSSDKTVWLVDHAMFNAQANDSMFGTSYIHLDNTTVFTLETNVFVQSVDFTILHDDDVVTTFAINIKAEDGTTNNNISTCRPSFSEISESSVNATFHCIPELDRRGSWYMDVGVCGTFESDTSDVVEFKMLDDRRKSKFVNLTLERGTNAKAHVVISKDVVKKNFLFLFSSLTFISSGVVSRTSFRIFHDISKTKTEGEFKFLRPRPNLELLEGEPFTIACDAIGRNPPPITMHKDGGNIRKSDQITSPLWSSSYVTYRHASKELEGNYSCLIQNNDMQLAFSPYTEVNLKPRIRWDLSTILENTLNLIRVSIVVEGAIGVSLDCNNDAGGEGNLTLSMVKTTSMSDWNERLEAEYTYREDLHQFRDRYISLMQLSCMIKDRNGQAQFEYNV